MSFVNNDYVYMMFVNKLNFAANMMNVSGKNPRVVRDRHNWSITYK